MKLYRLTKREYAEPIGTLLNGLGGFLTPGRWHRQGMAVTYLADSPACAFLEKLAHLDVSPGQLNEAFVMACLTIPDALVRQALCVTRERMEKRDPDWRKPGSRACLKVGAQWFEDSPSWALRVPSAVSPLEVNTVVNANHGLTRHLIANADTETVTIHDAVVDPRIAEVIDVTRRRKVKEDL